MKGTYILWYVVFFLFFFFFFLGGGGGLGLCCCWWCFFFLEYAMHFDIWCVFGRINAITGSYILLWINTETNYLWHFDVNWIGLLNYQICESQTVRFDGLFTKCRFLKLVILKIYWDPLWGNFFVHHSHHAHPNQVRSWGICPSPALKCANITAAQLKTGNL